MCAIVNLHQQAFSCIQSCQGTMVKFFSDGRWTAHLCRILINLKLKFEVECDTSVTPGHRERNTWCPKENDFFVVPRSDELLAAESSTKPELVELSAGDSWQHAMALVRQLSVTVGLGTIPFLQRLAVVSRFCMNGNFIRTWFFGTAACCTATSRVFTRMMKWTFILLWKMLAYKMPLRRLACCSVRIYMTLGYDRFSKKYDAQSNASSHASERRHIYTIHLSLFFTHQGYGQVTVITIRSIVKDSHLEYSHIPQYRGKK